MSGDVLRRLPAPAAEDGTKLWDAGLAAAKVARPEVPSGYVERPRLQAALEEAVTCPVTLVTGGPGWGKTTLVASWAEQTRAGRTVAWLTLDADDDEPRLFWASVLVALRSSGAVAADNPLAVIEPIGGLGPDTHRQIQVGLSRLRGDVVLVLDDVHELRSDAVHEQLARLFRYESPLRLVLVTRVEPRPLLHRLRVSGTLAEIHSDDLAFDAAEATELLVRQGIPAAHVADVGRLLVRTEGWAAGLRLAAMFLSRPGSDVSGFGGVDRSVADYLAAEVVAEQPPQTWQFLLRTSLVARVSGDLADALTGRQDGHATLAELERDNAFVTALGPERRWYRYHPLLADMLRRQIELEHPGNIPGLHERASHWFAAHGQPLEAVRHAAAARNWPLVGTMVTNVAAPRVLTADRHALASVLTQIPTGELAASPELQLCATLLCLFEERIADIEPHLVMAREQLGRQGADADPSTRVVLDLMTAAIARVQGSADGVVEAASGALETLDRAGSAIPLAREFRAVALGNKGVGLVWRGDLADAEGCLTAGLAAAEQLGASLAQLNSLGHLGLAAAVAGRLDEAMEWGRRGRDLAEARGWTTLIQATTVFVGLAIVSLQRHDLDEAEHLVALGLETQQNQREPHALAALRLTQASIDIARRRRDAARAMVDEVLSAFGSRQPPPLLRRWLVLTEAELALASDDAAGLSARLEQVPRDALSLVERLCLAKARLALGDLRDLDGLVAPVADQRADLQLSIEAGIVQALAADRAGRDSDALDALRRALRLARPDGFVAPFVSAAPQRVRGLLERLVLLRKGDPAFLRHLLDEQGDAAGGAAVVPPVEAVTEREKTVLHYLATMLTNGEIAEQLFVSPNTVKVHLRHVYRKLGVSTRRAAVARARELGLVDDDPA